MKILLVTEKYWPEVGAAPSRLANMAEGFMHQGCDVDVLTCLPNYPKGRIFDGYRGSLSKREEHNGIHLFRYWVFATVSSRPLHRILNMFSFAFMLWAFAFKYRRIKGYDCVIIQTPTLVAAASAMTLFKKLYRKKTVINVSDLWPSTAVDMGVMQPGSRSYRFMAVLEKYLYRNADGILGQSEEILNHVNWKLTEEEKPVPDHVLGTDKWRGNEHLFLYRNLQSYETAVTKKRNVKMRFVFCGMLGVAQNVAGIVKGIPWRELGVEFHILGGGKQLDEIKKYIAEYPDCGVFAHGFVAKEDVADRLKDMDASIVPLVTRIRGAVPSKIYDLLPQGIPILFCGEGEGSCFIERHQVGYTCKSGDQTGLTENIQRIRDLSDCEYEDLSARCLRVSREELNFDRQMAACYKWLLSLR